MSERLLALFDDPDTAEAAVTALGAREVEGVRVVSPAAYPVVHQTGRPGPWRLMGFLAVAGGLLGLATAIVLEVWSSTWMHLDVGGKAVVAWPAFTVVMFELTMLGAGLTNFTALIVLSWWSRRKVAKAARDAVVADRLAVVVPVDGKDQAAVDEIKRDLAGALSMEVAS